LFKAIFHHRTQAEDFFGARKNDLSGLPQVEETHIQQPAKDKL